MATGQIIFARYGMARDIVYAILCTPFVYLHARMHNEVQSLLSRVLVEYACMMRYCHCYVRKICSCPRLDAEIVAKSGCATHDAPVQRAPFCAEVKGAICLVPAADKKEG